MHALILAAAAAWSTTALARTRPVPGLALKLKLKLKANGLRRASAALVVFCVIGSVAAAQGPSRVDLAQVTLEDLMNITITTATRTAEGAAGAPARVQVVTAAQVLRRGYRSLTDLLKDLADFKVELGTDPDYPVQLTVQGSRGADRVVVLLDGVRVSSPTNEPLPILANYPVHAARQIEIMYGPASALYGADAFAAVINIISKDATDAPGLTFGTSLGQYGLYNVTGLYTANIGSASLMVAGQGQFDRQPDLSRYYPDFNGLQGQRSGTFQTIFGPVTPVGRTSPGYEIPLSAHSVEATLRRGGWRLMLFQNRASAPTAPATTPDNAVYNADVYNRNTLRVGAAAYTRQLGRATSTSTLTLSRHELDPRSGYRNAYSNMERSYKYAYGSMAKIEEQLEWKAGAAASFTAGTTLERFVARPQGADLESPVTSPDDPGMLLDTTIPDDLFVLHYSNAGAFGQLQYAFTPAVSLTLGARGDYNNRYGGTFNPRAGLVVHPYEGTTVKILAGRAYLAPSPYQAYSHYGAFVSADGGATYSSSYWHVPNPDLQPQEKSTIEVSLLQAVGGRVHLTASGFASRFTNLIEMYDAEQAYTGTYRGWPVDYIDFSNNEGRATTYGGNFGVDWLHTIDSHRQVTARASLSLVDGSTRENSSASGGTYQSAAIAPVQLRVGADIDWERWSLAPRLAVAGAQRVTALTDVLKRRTIPGYATVDVNLRRRALFPRVDAFLTIENALDARYRAINTRAFMNAEELIGVPQNPRRLTIGLDLRLK